jgi:hypothetical protein
VLNSNNLYRMPERIINLMTEIETEMLKIMALRLQKFNRVTGSIEYSMLKTQQVNILYKELTEVVGSFSSKTQAEINKLFNDAGVSALNYDNAIYKRAIKAGKEQGSMLLANDEVIQQILDGVKANAINSINLTNTKAISFARQKFLDLTDRAFLSVTTGVTDFATSYKSALREMAQEGIRSVEYTRAGKAINYSLEASVRRNITTALTQTTTKVSEANYQNMDCRIVEVSSHAGSRPEHAEWQGQRFYWGEEVEGYKEFVSSTGYGAPDGLAGINCRHFWFPYYEGISTPSFSTNPASELGIDNDKLYEIQQRQRGYERQIRSAKKDLEIYKIAGEKDLIAREKQKLASRRAKIREFIDENPVLRRDYSREFIAV